jgi:hypothetical protein
MLMEELETLSALNGCLYILSSAMQSGSPQTTGEAPVFLPADQNHVELVPRSLSPGSAHLNTKDQDALTRYEVP